MKQSFPAFLLTLLSINSYSATGDLFTITTSGSSLPTEITFTLCLNSIEDSGVSCQKFTTSKASISINTTKPNYTYTSAGIKIDTPNFSYSTAPGSNGFSALGNVSNTQAANGTITFTLPTQYVFATSTFYSGNLGGTAGADAICNSVGKGASSIIPDKQNKTFKALLIASTRYPCDASGQCGGSHAADWVIQPNVYYLRSDGILKVKSNDNAVLPQSRDYNAVLLLDEAGFSLSRVYWIGIQSIKLGSTIESSPEAYNIVGWGYYNVNPNSINSWNNYLATCNDWTSSLSGNFGASGSNYFYPILNGLYPNTLWGNYYRYDDNIYNNTYFQNTWIRGRPNISCDQASSIVCVSQ